MAARSAYHYPSDPLAKAGELTINGWNPLRGAEPADFYEQAHGVASFVRAAAGDMNGIENITVSPDILIEVFRSIETLIGLGLLADSNKELAK